MKRSRLSLRLVVRRCLVVLLCAGQIAPTLAAPAQQPLLGRAGPAVLPNVMFTLDDSGSMTWNELPDDAADGTFKYHPGEPDNQFEYEYEGALTSRLDDWLSARQRSVAWNKLYYDPETRYQTWTQADRTLMPAADPAAALIDPMHPEWGTVNLVGETEFTGNVCFSRTFSDSYPYGHGCSPVTGERIAVATWYDYIGPSMESMTWDDRESATRNPAHFKQVRIMDHEDFVHGPGRTDCPEVSPDVRRCSRAQEYQNFANWYSYNHKRYSQALTGLSAAFAAQPEGMRLGYGRINDTSISNIDGGLQSTVERGVRPYNGATRSAFFHWLFTTKPAGGTPLPRAMDDVGKYYSRSDNAGPWSSTPGTADPTPHLACRKSYHVLMTDGYWAGPATTAEARANVDGNPGPLIAGPGGQSWQYLPASPYRDETAGTLADVTLYYWYRDLRPDLPNRVPTRAEDPAFWQNMTTYTIGLGVNGALNHPQDLAGLLEGTTQWPDPIFVPEGAVDDLWHSALNGRGRYLSAKNGIELTDALSGILAEIMRSAGSTAGVSVSGRALSAGARKFVPSYESGSWVGNVSAFGLSADGTASGEVWNAEAALPAADARNIVVGTGANAAPRAVPFTWDSLTPGLKAALGPAVTEPVVNWLRGERSAEGAGLRIREGLIGDVVNSAPVYVRDAFNGRYQQLPAGTAGQASYAEFLEAKKAREGLVWFGANDGMLHAVRASDGVEVFAFIPNAVLSSLADLARPSYNHRYLVDGPLTEGDAWFGGAWRNVLVGSTGAGPRSVFALDVTNPSPPGSGSVLWELGEAALTELGHVLAPIELGRMRNGRWVAVFGNGYDSASRKASLFVVDLEDGSLIKRVDTGAGSLSSPNGLGGVRLVRDGQQTIVAAYAGDLLGNLWHFDLSSNTAAEWVVGLGGSPLHVLRRTDGTAQAVTAAPAVISHPRGGNMVLVGTGKLFEEGDQNTTTAESLYGLWDQQKLEQRPDGSWRWSAGTPIPSSARVKAGSLSAIGTGDYFNIVAPAIDWNTDRGWSLPLAMVASQRVTVAPQLVTGLLLVETLAPASGGSDDDPCRARSATVGYNLLIDPVNGDMSRSPVLDLSGDGVIDAGDPAIGAWKVEGWGGASVVLRNPPREVCLGSGCATAPTSPCPAGQIRSNLQSTGAGGTNVCVAVPGPQRWWWRQVSNP